MNESTITKLDVNISPYDFSDSYSGSININNKSYDFVENNNSGILFPSGKEDPTKNGISNEKFDKIVSETIDKYIKNVKNIIEKQYSREFPAIKYVSNATANAIFNLNKQETALSIKQIKHLYKNVGKELEKYIDNAEIIERYKKLENIVGNLHHAQLMEKQVKALEVAETEIHKATIIER